MPGVVEPILTTGGTLGDGFAGRAFIGPISLPPLRDGITVFPRLADPVRDDDYRLGEERISSGIAPLDRMLAEGYAPRSPTLRIVAASPSI